MTSNTSRIIEVNFYCMNYNLLGFLYKLTILITTVWPGQTHRLVPSGYAPGFGRFISLSFEMGLIYSDKMSEISKEEKVRRGTERIPEDSSTRNGVLLQQK